MKYIALKGFSDPAAANGYQRRGAVWTGSESRAKELMRLKLIAEEKGETNAAAPHPNKIAPPLDNKAGAPNEDASVGADVTSTAADGPQVGGAQSDAPSVVEPPDAVALSAAGSALVDQNVTDVLAALAGEVSREVLAAALEAEQAKGEKARKGVLEGLSAAIAAKG